MNTSRPTSFACSFARLAALVGSVAAFGACEYVEPVDARLRFPAEGTFIEGDPLVIDFTMPIEPSSLAVTIWNDARDLEGELPSDATPLLDRCTLAACPAPNRLTVADDRMSATLVVDPAGAGKPDVPLLIEVHAGLEGENGASKGASRIQDFQFKPAIVLEEAVPFEEGIYLFVSEFSEPVPNVITLMSDVRTNDRGRFLIVGAESDEIEGAAQNTRDPKELFIDVTDMGFVAIAFGQIRRNDLDQRFVETETFSINLRLGPMGVDIFGLRFTGIVVKHPDTGLDRIQGTLSYEGITLTNGNRPPFTYAAGTTTFIADQVPAEDVPEGTPDICDNPCGAVPSQCDVPAVWPPEGFCGVPYTDAAE